MIAWHDRSSGPGSNTIKGLYAPSEDICSKILTGTVQSLRDSDRKTKSN